MQFVKCFKGSYLLQYFSISSFKSVKYFIIKKTGMNFKFLVIE